MRLLQFLFFLAITLSLTFSLETKFGSVPPLGKFLDPFNGFWQNAEKIENPFSDLDIEEEVGAEVQIMFDEHLIPHIYAQNTEDLYFAQGYVTAKFRLWQMEFQTIAAAGRVSEVVGDQAIEFDRLQRRKGMAFGAENTMREFESEPELKELVEAFSRGVNAYISQLSYKDLPLEYKLLGYEPELWNAYKSSLLLKYMADMLAGGDRDLENTNFVKAFGRERFDFLFPDYYDDLDPVIPTSRVWDFRPVPVNEPQWKGFPFPEVEEIYEKPDPDNGSNNWAVSPSKTQNKRAILAGDPHLGLNLPSIWYSLHLNAPDVNVMGATLPGAPGVIIGFNDSVAWSVTNATRDVRDWYAIEFRDASRQEYKYDNNWLKTQFRIEEIKVRGGATFYDTVVYTHHGPVVYDQSFLAKEGLIGYALRWIAHEGSKEALTFHQLNRANNYNDYVKALQFYACPAQNFVFASHSGDVALWIQGKFPLKWQDQGKFLLDGSRPDHEWQGFIPTAHNPNVKNPPRGFVSSANQHPHDAAYPYWGYDGSYEFWRNRRINQQLEAMSGITVRDMMKLQNDNYNLKAFETLPHFQMAINEANLNTEEKELFDMVANWDLYNDVEKKGPVIWHIWWDEFTKMLRSNLNDQELPVALPSERMLQLLIENYPNDELFNLKETEAKESASDLARLAFGKISARLSKWKTDKGIEDFDWGTYKGASIQHLVPQLTPFSVENVRVGGDRNIVNANSARHGASWRMVVELGKEPKGYGIYPGGQSGNPGSRYYSNMIEKWRNGEYLELKLLSAAAMKNQNLLFIQTIKPKE